MSIDLCYLSATEALKAFTNKTLSPVELMTAIIQRVETVEPKINAFSHTYFDEAMDKARAAEKKYQTGAAVGALEGLPVAIKNETDIKGKANTVGSLIFQDNIAEENSILVDRLEQSGAIFHARTNCPEFCTLLMTHSRLHGISRNPWNLDMTPGGSSGGSGAALAAGMTTLASGSDMGGSIRQPASQNGIVGYKPPYGRNPEDGTPFNLDTYCHTGPMARTVADTALMQNILCGPHPNDIATLKPKFEIPLDFNIDMRGFKIAYSLDLDYVEVEQDVIDNTLSTLEKFRELGATIEHVQLNWDRSIEDATGKHFDQIFSASVAEYLENHRDQLCDYNAYYIEKSLAAATNPNHFYQSLEKAADMYDTFGPLMENYDAFICPTTTTTTVPAEFSPEKDKFIINGKEEDNLLSMAMCHQFNILSRCPTLAVPSGFGKNGVPSGIQITGKTFDDNSVFRAAAALEKIQPWLHDKQHQPTL